MQKDGKGPDVVLGSHLDQIKAVTQAEGLQDFRREREGEEMNKGNES
jgi:hypothetical protein